LILPFDSEAKKLQENHQKQKSCTASKNLNPGRNPLGVNDLMGGNNGQFCSLLRSQAAVLVQHYQPNDCLDDLSLR